MSTTGKTMHPSLQIRARRLVAAWMAVATLTQLPFFTSHPALGLERPSVGDEERQGEDDVEQLQTEAIGPVPGEGAAASGVEKASVNPGINETFLDPDLDVPSFINRFEVESREVFRARREIVEAVGLKSGLRVADIGTGTGLFITAFAKAVGPDGRVLGVDIAPRFVSHVQKLAEAQNLTQVETVLCRENSVALPEDSIDVAFVCDTYHHFEFPMATLASIKSALRPGGLLVVVDFERIPGVSSDWIMGHVRAGKSEVRGEIEKAGFKFDSEVEIEGLEDNYFLRFTCPE